eukprot:TRINITY_DN49269_c2_g1_i1.p4 TRINITY_DN49269_c2_g1~~TRINITY_DN49269_c2_g1_i1.p4  ORF type:complete len:136 (+),score=6.48 TRINITY_DN49269_c2_g1_i1:190-597(+)
MYEVKRDSWNAKRSEKHSKKQNLIVKKKRKQFKMQNKSLTNHKMVQQNEVQVESCDDPQKWFLCFQALFENELDSILNTNQNSNVLNYQNKYLIKCAEIIIIYRTQSVSNSFSKSPKDFQTYLSFLLRKNNVFDL